MHLSFPIIHTVSFASGRTPLDRFAVMPASGLFVRQVCPCTTVEVLVGGQHPGKGRIGNQIRTVAAELLLVLEGDPGQ